MEKILLTGNSLCIHAYNTGLNNDKNIEMVASSGTSLLRGGKNGSPSIFQQILKNQNKLVIIVDPVSILFTSKSKEEVDEEVVVETFRKLSNALCREGRVAILIRGDLNLENLKARKKANMTLDRIYHEVRSFQNLVLDNEHLTEADCRDEIHPQAARHNLRFLPKFSSIF